MGGICAWPGPEPPVKDNAWRHCVWLCRASRDCQDDRGLWLRHLNKLVVGSPPPAGAVEWFTERSGAPAWQVGMLRDALTEGTETRSAAKAVTAPAVIRSADRIRSLLVERGSLG